MTSERFCTGTKPDNEHDRMCYYHGPEKICPLCGKKTRPVFKTAYTELGAYDIVASIRESDLALYGGWDMGTGYAV